MWSIRLSLKELLNIKAYNYSIIYVTQLQYSKQAKTALFIFAAVPAVQPQEPTLPPLSTSCNKGLVANNIDGAINEVDNCTFFAPKVNASCLKKSCPGLTSELLCPVYNNGTNNIENAIKVLRQVSQCLKGDEICGSQINPINIPKLQFNASQILSGTSLTGICYVDKGTSTIDNINNTQLSLVNATSIPPSAPLMFKAISENVVYNGTFSCVLTSTFIDEMLNSTNKTVILKLTNVTYLLQTNFSSVSIVNLTDTNNNNPNVQSGNLVVVTHVGQFDVNEEFSFLNIQTILQDLISSRLESSYMVVGYGSLMSALVNSAFEIAKESCT
ncbi:hypothetical protein CHUAL_006502 [Chamberlinius hualienensis]